MRLCWMVVDPNEIGFVIFVSQTPDYVLPATSAVLAARLVARPRIVRRMSSTSAVQDMPAGGVWQASASGCPPSSRCCWWAKAEGKSQKKIDQSPRFGDCGTATLLEKASGAPDMVLAP